jgi:CRP-like cAMP-binding protein
MIGLTAITPVRDPSSMATVGDVTRYLRSGEVLFRQGDAGDEMFFVSSGRVSLRLGTGRHEREVAVAEPGGFFGELALLHDAPRTLTAIAAVDTVLLAVRRETFALMMNDDLEVVYRMLAALGRRFAGTDQHIAELARRLRRSRIVAHLLGRCLAGRDDTVEVDASTAARVADMDVDEAEAVLRSLSDRGIGRLEGTCWHVVPAVDGVRLAEVLGADE